MMKNLYFLSSLTFLIVAGCSSGNNGVTITPNAGQCVQASMYNSSVIPPTNIESNPLEAPYCMSFQIQNNNSSSTNNIQITTTGTNNGTGLVMSYSVGATTYSSQMVDPVAAELSIGGTTQTLGNISVYDPYNCLTTQGANVITLGNGGGNCTFYLQLVGESFPVGAYGINLSYNYTNGNANYVEPVNINERVNLYAGSSTGIVYINNSESFVDGATLPVPITTTDNAPITGLSSDAFGNVYISTTQDVYQFNGVTVNPLNLLPSQTTINGITNDINGFVYAATNNGIYKYNTLESIPIWTPFFYIESTIGINTKITSIKSYPFASGNDVIYATTESAAYICQSPSGIFNLCDWKQLTSAASAVQPPSSFSGASGIAVDINGNLYTANFNSVYSYLTTGWQSFPYFNESSNNLTGNIDAVYWELNNGLQYLYVGEFNAESALESSVYTCIPVTPGSSTGCVPLLSESGNSLTGNVYGIIADGANNIYAVGNSLNSIDFGTTINQYGAYLTSPINESGIGSSLWTPIGSSNISGGNLSVLSISSMLTTY